MTSRNWAIYARPYYMDFFGNDVGKKVPVCTFPDLRSANLYLEQSKLKKRSQLREFKVKSLLSSYADAHIAGFIPNYPPHNPSLS